MTTAVHVTLPHAAVLNANMRPNRYKKSAMTAVIRERFRIAGRQGTPLVGLVHCTALLSFPDPGRRRDANNWAPTTKAGVDGLVDAGLLVDDDHRHLIGPDHRIDPEPCAKGHVRITIILEPVNE